MNSSSNNTSQDEIFFTTSGLELFVISAINSVCAFLGVFGNAFVLFALATQRKLRTSSNVFIGSLSTADFLVCLTSQPMYVVSIHGFNNMNFIIIRKILTWIFTIASLNNIVGVTCDRFAAVHFPFFYRSGLHDYLVAPSLILIWVTSISLGTFSGIVRTARVISQYFCLLTMSCVIIMYVNVLTVSSAHQQRLMRWKNIRSTTAPSPLARSKQKAESIKQNHISRTIALVCALFVISWLPLLIFPFFYHHLSKEAMNHTFYWLNTVALSNSCINAYVYCGRNQDFQRVAKKSFLKYRMSFKTRSQDTSRI